MGRCNVEHNKKWACFSSIVDAFITEFISKSKYEEWRKLEYGKHLNPLESNVKTINDILFSIRLNRTHDEAIECLLESGLSKEESEKFICDMETEYYVPTQKEDGKFVCPNCHKEIQKGQVECDNDSCCLEFIWRD